MIIKHKELGSLSQIADVLWKEMQKEIERNGHSDLTLDLEAAVNGIRDIIEINGIEEQRAGFNIPIPPISEGVVKRTGDVSDCDWAAPIGTPIPEYMEKKRPGLPTRKRKKKPWEK